MANFLAVFHKIMHGLFPLSSPPLAPPEDPEDMARIDTAPQSAVPPTHPGRVLSDALGTIYADLGLEGTVRVNPTPADVARAWGALHEPVKSYIKALTHSKRIFPRCRGDYGVWLTNLEAEAKRDHDTLIGAIIRGAELVSTERATTVLADRARSKGERYLDLSAQGDIERKVHVCDGSGRPLFLRCREIEGLPIRLIDHGDDFTLAVRTRDDSGWRCHDGWLVPAVPGRKRPGIGDNGGNLPVEKTVPTDGKPTVKTTKQ